MTEVEFDMLDLNIARLENCLGLNRDMQQWQTKVRKSLAYRDAVDLIDEIKDTKNKLALLEASLKQMGDAGQLASLDDMRDRLERLS